MELVLPMYNVHSYFSLKNLGKALAGVAQWNEHKPLNLKVPGLIPSQGTCLGCGPGPHLVARKRQPHIDVSLRFSLPPFPSL